MQSQVQAPWPAEELRLRQVSFTKFNVDEFEDVVAKI